MVRRWTANWPPMESRTAGASADGGGRSGESLESGWLKERKRKRAAVVRPVTVACVSDMRTPAPWRTERPYAEMRQLSERILNICVVVTSVHRPDDVHGT